MIGAALLVAGALAAGPTPLLDAPRAQDVALAGGEVLVARPGPRGGARVDAVALDTGAVRRVLRAKAPGPGWSPRMLVAASPTRVAVVVSYAEFGGNGLESRLYSGPIGGPLQLDVVRRGKGWLPVEAAVDGDRVLVIELRLRSPRTRLRLLAPGAAPRVLVTGRVDLADLAGDHFAYTTYSNRLVVADLATGTPEVDTRLDGRSDTVDVAADGRVVAGSDQGVVTAAPGTPSAVLPGSARLFAPRWSGTRVAALRYGRFGAVRPVVLEPSGPHAVGPLSLSIQALDADDAGVAWIGNGCVLHATAAAAAADALPPGACPRAEAIFEGVDDALHGRRLRVQVSCVAAPASGCRGTVVLRLGGVAGRARYEVAAGRRGTATVRLTPRAARLVRERVRRHGATALTLVGRLRAGRPPEPGQLLVVDRVS